jgi:large subunit ribosomal protein L23
MERLSDKLNQYGFLVEKSANKLQIKSAIEELYGVSVDSINTIRSEGKLKTRYTRSGYLVGRTNGVKKAIVTLKKGEKIDFYSNI